ncbi:MAG: alpha-glucan family phosphorylase [Rhodothermales bacterium]|nr:alpha-glucan family phosphorylase [Rhodothermales bacterium]
MSETVAQLKEIANNLWWSWNPEAQELFRELNPGAFESSKSNPVLTLKYANEDILEDVAFRQRVSDVHARLTHYLETPGKFSDGPQTAYFCMEFGLHESLPLYSGGLGILAGDHTKGASDLGVPFVAIGLFLRDGYLRQFFDGTGYQQDEYPALDTTRVPVELVTDSSGLPVTVEVLFGSDVIKIQAWKLLVGKSIMYLLDTDFDGNEFDDRFITHRLYSGARRTRIKQEIILGIGGMRMLRKLGIDPDVVHLNEGHCAFACYEMLRENLRQGIDLNSAEENVRECTVFTTHTPVKAGHDRFAPELFVEMMEPYAGELGLSINQLLSYGRVNTDDDAESFTMTVLGLKLSCMANGVSRLNGEVARDQWKEMYPDRSVDEVPISHVTNGIHLPTWTSAQARPFLEKFVPGWQESAEAWMAINEIPDGELWAYRSRLRHAMTDRLELYLRKQSLPQNRSIDPKALTIGFARRFATYKRALLLFHDIDRLINLVSNSDRPLQVVFAGKAHPADESGKALIQQLFEFTRIPELHGRIAFIENYDMSVGRALVSGCDVWLNNPRRPYEASGTSGQKVAVHGGLNLSILDGWWPEGYNGSNGWSIGDKDSAEYMDPDQQDNEDANYLYSTLENKVIPMFYSRDEADLPREWISMMRSAMSTLPYQFSARRMVSDYAQSIYGAVGKKTVSS